MHRLLNSKFRKSFIGIAMFLCLLFGMGSMNKPVQAASITTWHNKYIMPINYRGYKRSALLHHYINAVIPANNGAYYVYVEPNEQLRNYAYRAINLWSKSTNIPIRLTNNMARAQFRIRPVTNLGYSKYGSVEGESNTYVTTFRGTHDDNRNVFALIRVNVPLLLSRNTDPTLTLMHEMGHAFGLKHVKDTHSVMYPTDDYKDQMHITKQNSNTVKRIYRA